MDMDFEITKHIHNMCYSQCVEVTVAIRDMDREYYIGPRWTLGSSTSLTGHYVRILWKPPGALQWVEKCVTENLSGRKELKFAAKSYFEVDQQDLGSIKLCFEFLKTYSSLGCEGGRWSYVETDLSKCVAAGAAGLLLPLPLKLALDSKYSRYMQDALKKQSGAPEFVAFADIKTEIVKSQSMEKLGMKLCLSINKPNIPTSQYEKYSVEFSKQAKGLEFHGVEDEPLNPGSLELCPFVLIHRQVPTWSSPYVYANESKLFNGDENRIFMVSVTKRKSGRRKGSAFISLHPLLHPSPETGMTSNAITTELRGFGQIVWGNAQASLSLLQVVHYKTYEDYLKLGLQFVRIYAVDYSASNWDPQLHEWEALHSPQAKSGKSAYEEVLELLALSYDHFCTVESFFYPFGSDVQRSEAAEFISFMSKEVPEVTHYKALMELYTEHLNITVLRNINLGIDVPRPHLSISSYPATPPPNMKNSCKKKLSFILRDILSLISSQNPQRRLYKLQYFTVFILTDGEFADIDECAQLVMKLSQLQVSLVFIGLGNGDFGKLRKLVEEMSPLTSRNNMHLIHFRNLMKWRSALVYYKAKSRPETIFRKEMFTNIREQCVAYIRMKYPEL